MVTQLAHFDLPLAERRSLIDLASEPSRPSLSSLSNNPRSSSSSSQISDRTSTTQHHSTHQDDFDAHLAMPVMGVPVTSTGTASPTKKPLVNGCRLLTCCACWYICAASTSALGKDFLNEIPSPLTRTLFEFVGISLLSTAALLLQSTPTDQQPTVRLIDRTLLRTVLPLSLLNVLSYLASSWSLSLLSVSLFHTIKVVSPLLIAACGHRASTSQASSTSSRTSPLSLLPITAGLLITCYTDTHCHWLGVTLAVLSAWLTVLETALCKDALTLRPSLRHQTARKLEKPRAVLPFFSVPQDDALQRHQSLRHVLQFLSHASTVSWLMVLPLWLFSRILGDTAPHFPPHTIAMMALSSAMHFGQCVFAFLVLQHVSPVAFALAAVLKRMAVVALAALYFESPCSLAHSIAMVLTYTGVYIHQRVHLRDAT